MHQNELHLIRFILFLVLLSGFGIGKSHTLTQPDTDFRFNFFDAHTYKCINGQIELSDFRVPFTVLDAGQHD